LSFSSVKQEKAPVFNCVFFFAITGKVAAYKQLRGGLFIVPMLPKSKTGKISRAEVVSMGVAAPAC